MNQQNDDNYRNYDPDAPYKHCGASKHHIDRQKRPTAVGSDHPLPQSGRPCAAQSRFGLSKSKEGGWWAGVFLESTWSRQPPILNRIRPVLWKMHAKNRDTPRSQKMNEITVLMYCFHFRFTGLAVFFFLLHLRSEPWLSKVSWQFGISEDILRIPETLSRSLNANSCSLSSSATTKILHLQKRK